MGKLAKAAVVVGGLVVLFLFFVIPTMVWVKSYAIWRAYWGYVGALSNLTGVNQYLVTAAALVMLVPFYIGADMLFSFRSLTSRRRRYAGAGILLALAIGYNLSLYYATKDVAFAFVGGSAQKWYALTPEGVKFYDREGVDPQYGIKLKPVTPEMAPKLRLLQKGEFKPIDPTRVTFFNPITGDAQVWYYQYPDGTFEFYDKPGYHPITGTALLPVTQQIYFEWRKTQKARPQAAIAGEEGAAGRFSPGTRTAAVLEVRSDPQGADIYLDWKAKGQTPVPLDERDAKGLLVVVKEGHQAGFRRIDARARGEVEFTLPPEGKRSRTRLLLLPSEGTSGESFASLRSRLVEEGFTVLGPEEAREFQRELEKAGGLSHRGLRAWARARFDTDLLLMARFQQSSRELSEQELGYLNIREAVKGAVRAEVGIELEVVDLRSGDHVAAVSGKGSGFALDKVQGFQKALTQATSETAKLLRQRIQG